MSEIMNSYNKKLANTVVSMSLDFMEGKISEELYLQNLKLMYENGIKNKLQ